jgi:hypothetical protein
MYPASQLALKILGGLPNDVFYDVYLFNHEKSYGERNIKACLHLAQKICLNFETKKGSRRSKALSRVIYAFQITIV